MNDYPVWWDTTLTIYNKYEDPQTQIISWYRHTVNNCFWKDVGNKVVVNDVTIETNNIICRIPKDDRFLEYYQWIENPNDTMDNFFTLHTGDIVVRGEITDTINEYRSGQRSTDFLKKHKALQGCLIIEEVGINVGPGRCNEHYFVKGI